MAEKCPYCYRPLGTHIHDPILLPYGSQYKWADDTHLVSVLNVEDRIYKGVYQVEEDEIIELQDELETLETENGITPLTVFSPINSSGKFQFTGYHLKEMRDSVEKLLIASGLTKTEYFNYDEEENHIIHPNGDKINWTDPITLATDLEHFQIKAIHIEDLRHFIQMLWKETWVGHSGYSYSYNYMDSHNFTYPYSGFQAYGKNAEETPIIWGDKLWDTCQMFSSIGMNDIDYMTGYPKSFFSSVRTHFAKITSLITDLSTQQNGRYLFGSTSSWSQASWYIQHSSTVGFPIQFKLQIDGLGGTFDVESIMQTTERLVPGYPPFSFPGDGNWSHDIYGKIGVSIKLTQGGITYYNHDYTIKLDQYLIHLYELVEAHNTEDYISSGVYETGTITLPAVGIYTFTIRLYASCQTSFSVIGSNRIEGGDYKAAISDLTVGSLKIIKV